MTPLPKYFAISNANLGTNSLRILVLLVRTGKRAPAIEPRRTMKTDAIRRPVKVWAPPPEPQLRLSSSSRTRSLGRIVCEKKEREIYERKRV